MQERVPIGGRVDAVMDRGGGVPGAEEHPAPCAADVGVGGEVLAVVAQISQQPAACREG